MPTPPAAAPTDLPRPEYPRPQFVRERWVNLNGSVAVRARPGRQRLVPRPARPTAQRHHHRTVLPRVRALGRRQRRLPPRRVGTGARSRCRWTGRGCGRCCTSRPWTRTRPSGATAKELYRHRGGMSPFTVDLGDCRRADRQDHRPRPRPARGVHAPRQTERLVRQRRVHVHPDHRHLADRLDGAGADAVAPSAAHHARPSAGLLPRRATPRPSPTASAASPGSATAPRCRDGDTEIARAEVPVVDFAPMLTLSIPDEHRRLWSLDDPFLYDLTLELLDAEGAVLDRATSYAGLRSVTIDGRAVKLNGEAVFQRLVLDQGYYPDGILNRALGPGADRGHPPEQGGGVQRGAAAPEGFRGTVPLPRRPDGLPLLGRVLRLGARPAAALSCKSGRTRGRATSPSGSSASSGISTTRASSAGAR